MTYTLLKAIVYHYQQHPAGWHCVIDEPVVLTRSPENHNNWRIDIHLKCINSTSAQSARSGLVQRHVISAVNSVLMLIPKDTHLKIEEIDMM